MCHVPVRNNQGAALMQQVNHELRFASFEETCCSLLDKTSTFAQRLATAVCWHPGAQGSDESDSSGHKHPLSGQTASTCLFASPQL